MLRNAKDIYNYVLEAEDWEIGRCKDFLFDDKQREEIILAYISDR